MADNKYQIAIVGWAGTGTSTAAKGVLERLGNDWIICRPASDVFRALAATRYPNLTTGQALSRLEKDAAGELAIDLTCDEANARLGKDGDKVILDARLAAKFMPDAIIKAYLFCSEDSVRYMRIAQREGKTSMTARKETLEREKHARARYEALYGITDLLDQDIFDLVLDTSLIDASTVVDRIVQKFYEKASVPV